jgi:hypothetical protein
MLTDLLNDFAHEFIELDNTIETIPLETEQIDLALQQSQTVKSEQQWSVYLRQLAQFGFENWLQKREPQLTVIPGESIVSLESIIFLQVGEFKLCLIPTNGMGESDIIIPRAVIELPEFAAHFYMPIGVAEDLELIGVLGFLTYNQLADEASQTQPLIDWTYAIPREYFNPDTDELLLNLQCLAAATIPLPAIPDNRQAELAAVKTQLETLLPQATNRPLWQVLNWTEAKVLLTHSSLLNWLNDAQPNLAISELLQLLTQPVISVGTWLQNQFDEVSQSLAWQPLPLPMRGFLSTLAPAASPVIELEDILNQLQNQYQIQVPPEAACRRENLPNHTQLYAITWRRPQDEWALLLIATTSSEAVSPSAMQWRISDENQVLIDRKLSPEAAQTYLFTQIVGEIGEKFLVNVMIDHYPQIARVFMF